MDKWMDGVWGSAQSKMQMHKSFEYQFKRSEHLTIPNFWKWTTDVFSDFTDDEIFYVHMINIDKSITI